MTANDIKNTVKRSRPLRMALLCAAGVILNIAGAAVASWLKVPYYLDTAGTVAAAALGGFLPGVIVGLATNMIRSAFDSSQLYFGSVNMLFAVITAYLSHKGVFRRFPRALLAVPAYVFTGGVLGSVIYWFIYNTNSSGIASSVGHYLVSTLTSREFGEQLLYDLRIELVDKTVTVAFVYLLLRLMPGGAKRLFEALDIYYGRVGEKTAEVPDNWLSASREWLRSLPERIKRPAAGERDEDGKHTAKERAAVRLSLRTKMMILLLISSVMISAAAAAISYILYREYTYNEHIRTANGVTALVRSMIDPDQVDIYIEEGFDAVGYRRIDRELSIIKDSHVDVQFLYVYKIMPDGCHVVFDVDTEEVKASAPGEILPFEKSFEPYLDRLLAGERIEPIVSDDSYGYLLTVYEPLYDGMGRCRCYIAVDFSMNLLAFYGGVFMARLLSMFVGFFIFILTVGLYFIERGVILPVNSMAYCAGTFAYDSEEQRASNVEHIKGLDIRTGDEIENLYRAFLRTTEDSMDYMEKLRRARVEVADMKEQVSIMDEIAHNDSLTGVRNKTAYDEDTAALDAEIAGGTADFCVIMVDVNFLKRTNDLYGHERGNIYLENSCELVCEIFGRDNVYRIGGDEFVVILRGRNRPKHTDLIARFKRRMAQMAADDAKQPWEKVSAAVGAADYRRGKDRSADEVFKRADKLMYEDKLAMKAQRTD